VKENLGLIQNVSDNRNSGGSGGFPILFASEFLEFSKDHL